MQKKEAVQKDDVVQAVVIADCYQNTFRPVTDLPALLPLVNKPLLAYTLECLSAAKVDEAIVFCSFGVEEVKYLVSCREWGRMSVTVITSDRCSSLGDAMRDLDAKAILRGDFILVTGNLIGNLDLLSALERHRKIQKTDKGASMTLVYKECGGKSRSIEDEMYLGIDGKTDRILAFQRRLRGSLMEIDMEAILAHGQVDIRNDLFDCKVSICSMNVPPLFSDNFDFQSLDDFVHGLIINEDIIACTVYSYILTGSQYAATVTSWQNYHYISKDVVHRWTYPFVPDLREDERYTYNRNSIYLQDVSLAKDCRLKSDVVIGKESIIKEMAHVLSSVVGKRCTIGANSVISNSYIFDDVVIEDESTIDHCVIASGCKIGSGSSLSGCILGPKVEIDIRSSVEQSRLQHVPKSTGEGDPIGGKAFEYTSDADEGSDSDSEDEGCVMPGWRGLNYEQSKPEAEDDDSDSLSGESTDGAHSPIQDDTNLFYSEIVDSMLRGYEDKLPCDNLVLEINSSRYAYNVPLSEVNYNVVRAILTLEQNFTWESLADRLKYFKPLFVNYMRNKDAMLECLNAIEDVAAINPPLALVTMKLIHVLYDRDILTEDPILHWYRNPRSDEAKGQQLRESVKRFIEWLEKAEPSDDEESDDESEDD
ncbi:translation Initiation Factor [Nesidiocoris tenuis]|uniref:Translation initiation factor eIF2B subunit epsilon n=1 Tax=Nesidiocoris tenuis TaxID=355587 RepID=A0ABN7BAP5_9HEMI|nr:translation Initiation Factor [Nesidiocoris tenuis]